MTVLSRHFYIFSPLYILHKSRPKAPSVSDIDRALVPLFSGGAASFCGADVGFPAGAPDVACGGGEAEGVSTTFGEADGVGGEETPPGLPVFTGCGDSVHVEVFWNDATECVFCSREPLIFVKK
nr:unnamed protein product [Callosobruchus chinensis]